MTTKLTEVVHLDAWFLSEYLDMEFAIQYREAHVHFEEYFKGFVNLTLEQLIVAKGFGWRNRFE